MHREFKSAFPEKLVIERDKIWTENWSKTQWKGRINLENFMPYPKNLIIAKFFVNIGYADSLDSGVRNLYKFTKNYSDAEPDFEENDIFRLTVPMRSAGAVKNATETLGKFTERQNRILELIRNNASILLDDIAADIGVSTKTESRDIKELKGMCSLVYDKKQKRWILEE